MSSNRRILIFIDWYYPAYKAGGPLKSVFHLVSQLNERYDFMIVSSNKDIDGKELDVNPNEIIEEDGIKKIYLSESHQNKKEYARLFSEFRPDVVYLNSLFSVKYSLIPLILFRRKLNLEVVVAPRGMLGEGALQLKKHKKQLFLKLAKSIGLFKRVLWHATAEEEAQEIIKNFGKGSRIIVASNLSNAPCKRDLSSYRKNENKLSLVFISRISIKKNLFFILNLLNKIQDKYSISLDIYGPIEEPAYWEQCLREINKNDNLTYRGELHPSQISETLVKYDFFVLPTLNENYGHAIVESINVGVPVLISDNTPWKDLKGQNIGIEEELERLDSWEYHLDHFYRMKHADYKEMVEACYKFAEENIVNKEIKSHYYKLFN